MVLVCCNIYVIYNGNGRWHIVIENYKLVVMCLLSCLDTRPGVINDTRNIDCYTSDLKAGEQRLLSKMFPESWRWFFCFLSSFLPTDQKRGDQPVCGQHGPEGEWESGLLQLPRHGWKPGRNRVQRLENGLQNKPAVDGLLCSAYELWDLVFARNLQRGVCERTGRLSGQSMDFSIQFQSVVFAKFFSLPSPLVIWLRMPFIDKSLVFFRRCVPGFSMYFTPVLYCISAWLKTENLSVNLWLQADREKRNKTHTVPRKS